MLAIFLVAALAQTQLREQAQRARQTESALSSIRSRVSILSLHQGRALTSGIVSPGLRATIAAINRDVDSSLADLPAGEHIAQVRTSTNSYRSAVAEDLALIEQDRLDEAQILHSEKVDLWFEALNRATDNALAAQRAVVLRADRITTTGSLATLAAACLMIGLLLLRFERARRAAINVRQRALAESEARFRALVQNSNDVITVIDPDGHIRYQSPAGLAVFGVNTDEAVGSLMADFVEGVTHPRDLPLVLTFLRDALMDDTGYPRAEFRVRGGDGSWRFVESIATNCLQDPFVLGLVLTSRDISERKALEERLRYQAFHDPLTHLPNRALLLDRLEVALARRIHRQHPLAVLLLDLDGFKGVNDSLGHAAGDDLLVQVSERLRECVRAADSVARLGGDEFAIVLEDMMEHEDATLISQRILDSFSEPFFIEKREIFVRASLGIVVTMGTEHSPVELLRDADVAMYAAKAEGKNRCRFFEPSMREAVMNRMTLEADLRSVIERGQMTLFYQPVVDLATRRISGMEALARWRHPERGLISPAQFIPLAEESGLIVDIGRWVLHEACRQAKEWQERYPDVPPLKMSINISGRQLQHPGLVEDLQQVLGDLRLVPSTLVLEITESILMRHTGKVEDTLAGLQSLGVRLAIDDFGTGYSSLSYLQSFPIDILKIDRSFVMRVAGGPEESALARAIVKLAHTLDLVTVAEGIEDEFQLARLRELGCILGQGYYFSRPLPMAEMDDLLRVGRAGELWTAEAPSRTPIPAR